MKRLKKVKEYYDYGKCPDCGKDIPKDTVEGEECTNCGHIFWVERTGDDKGV